MDGRKLLTLNYDECFLPRINLFCKGTAEPTMSALNSVVSPETRNMSPLKKLWMMWHIRLGHLSFE